MRYLAYSVLSVALMLGVNSAFAAGDIKAGKIKSAICATCHGADGKATMQNYPNLAGQNEAYLVSALQSYRSKQRNGGMASVMQMQAANLSDQDIENLAAYFSSLKP